MKELKSYRMSQGLTTFGIGSIIGIGDESFINTGVTNEDDQNFISFPRLARRLKVSTLRYPKVKYIWGENGKLNIGNKFNFMRFPSWMFCPSCRMMKHITPSISNELNGRIPNCDNRECKGVGKTKLQPARFVIACEHGHIGEFPWKYWAHSKQNENIAEMGNCQLDKLFFRVRSGVGAGWDSLVVSCVCGASRSLSDLNGNPDALKSIGQKCKGKQPWQSNADQECGETPRVSQKNASNIYQPVIVSAIDVAVSSKAPKLDNREAKIKGHVLYPPLVKRYEEVGIEDQGLILLAETISNDANCPIDKVLDLIQSDGKIEEDDNENVPSNIYELNQSLQEDEYPSFFTDIKSKLFINTIEKIDVNLDSSNAKSLSSLIENVSLVKKLREVRAFKGFNRIEFDPGKIVPPSLDLKPNWLPAIEVFGEGIFLSINEEKLDNWYKSNKASIDDKMDPIMRRYISKNNDERFGPFSAKFVLLHTLSHLLIRQLSFESGYNASALRESIYFSEEATKKMAGILIYTADSDSEGSLGGLVRQGQWERLLPTILLSLEKALWCSSDPVCSESKGQGHNGLNQGACHACGLISETSCTHLNTLLSRTLLIDKEIGFFKDII
jgi:hypothetical protein